MKKTLTKAMMMATALVSLVQAANADANLVGSFRGKIQQGGSKVDLVMRSLTSEGRDGSYLGVLIQNDPLKIAVYLIDKLEGDEYVMQPREVTADGQIIGTNNPDPSLTLQITSEEQSGRPSFTITSAKSSNQSGFQGAMMFKSCDSSDAAWLDITPGTFELDHSRVVIPSQMVDHQANLTLTMADPLNGNFVIREKLPGLYTLEAVSVLATGEQKARFPSKIALFVHKDSLFGGDYFLLINPNDYSDVIKIKRKY